MNKVFQDFESCERKDYKLDLNISHFNHLESNFGRFVLKLDKILDEIFRNQHAFGGGISMSPSDQCFVVEISKLNLVI